MKVRLIRRKYGVSVEVEDGNRSLHFRSTKAGRWLSSVNVPNLLLFEYCDRFDYLTEGGDGDEEAEDPMTTIDTLARKSRSLETMLTKMPKRTRAVVVAKEVVG